MNTLVWSLDDVAWALQEAVDKGTASQLDYVRAFRRARAANGLLDLLENRYDTAVYESACLLYTSGAHFPHRDLIIFLTFTVILVTLVGGGLTLPAVVRKLHITGGGNEEREEIRLAMIRSTEAALARIDQLETDGRIESDHAAALRRQFEHKREGLRAGDEASKRAHLAQHVEAERAILDAQRQAIIEMREHGEIDNVIMRKLLTEFDLAASRPTLQSQE